jgi:hypothetical protein
MEQRSFDSRARKTLGAPGPKTGKPSGALNAKPDIARERGVENIALYFPYTE